MNTHNINETAHTLNQHHINTIPTRGDTTKAPAITWKHWTTNPIPTSNINQWFPDNTQHGLAIITGTISDNLEMTEIEGGHTHQLQTLLATANTNGTRPLFDRITNGWLEQSPSGGYHWIYRLKDTDVPGNQKLARTTNREVIAETRGQGGYFIAAPTNGTHHQTGNPWTRINGGPETIATITAEEREQFHHLFRTLNQEPTPQPTPAHNPARTPTRPGEWANGAKPGEHFETETSWDTILTPHGWTRLRTDNQGTTYWLRPGKDPHNPGTDSQSATTSHAEDRDRLYVFSTSTAFEPETPYTKFGAWALLNHGGDHQAAARALAADGWGKEPTITLTSIMPPTTSKDNTKWNSTSASQEFDSTNSTSSASPKKPNDEEASTPTGPGTNPPAETSPTASPSTSTTEPDSSTSRPTKTASTSPTDPTEPAGIPVESDTGNAHLLIHQHHTRIRYCTDRGRWYVWNGHIWEQQATDGGKARELAIHTASQLPAEDNQQKTWRKKSLSALGITNTLTQARNNPAIAITYNQFDSHPWELNTPGGIIDLTTGELTPPDPDKLHTRSTKVTPDFNADNHMWETYLKTTFPGHPELIDYLQRLIGYTAVGRVKEHILPFAYGSGANGKSVLMETMTGILNDYAATTPSGFFMASKYQEHSTGVADIAGARMVTGSEVNATDKFDEQKVKQLTGGDTIKARFMRQDYFEFRPTGTFWLSGNFYPAVESGGDSFWRRLRLIPFTHTFTEDERIDDLQGLLLNEHAPAILAWIVRGAADYFRNGLQEPAIVTEATEQYKESQDTVTRFLEERCTVQPGNPNYTASVKQFRQEYEAYCVEEGDEPVKGRALSTQLKQHGMLVGKEAPRVPSGADRVYGGVQLNSDVERATADHARADLFG